jgi:hypothetical protein
MADLIQHLTNIKTKIVEFLKDSPFIHPFTDKRTVIFAVLSLAIIYYHMAADPSGKFTIIAFLGLMVTPVFAVWFSYIARKILFIYVDLKEFANKALESPIGAGLVFLGMCVLMYGLLGLFGSQLNMANAQTIPARAYTYMPVVKEEQNTFWAEAPIPFTYQDLSSTNPV